MRQGYDEFGSSDEVSERLHWLRADCQDMLWESVGYAKMPRAVDSVDSSSSCFEKYFTKHTVFYKASKGKVSYLAYIIQPLSHGSIVYPSSIAPNA